MHSTSEYFPDRLVIRNVRYVPNPAGTIIRESTALTPSTWIADSHERPSVHAIPPDQRRRIRDMGYSRGIDVFEEGPYDEFSLCRPRSMHGRKQKYSGKFNEVLGRLMRNPRREAQGEERVGLGNAEIDMAREYTMRVRQAHDGYGNLVGDELLRPMQYGSAGPGRNFYYVEGDRGYPYGY